jgi:hypothetical protein
VRGAFERVDDPRVLVPRERDPLTGRLTSTGDDRPGKRRRSHEPARPRFSRGLVVAAAVVGVFVLAGVAIAVASGGGGDTTTAPSATVGPDNAGTGGLRLAQLEGTWRFDLRSPKVNYVSSSRFTAAQVSVALSGNRIRLEARIDANNFHRVSDVNRSLAGVERVSCSAASCGAGLTGFVTLGNEIRVVNRATLEPYTAGAGLCGAPAVANAGVVRTASSSSFRYLTGETYQSGSDCYQVVWTVVATKVS